MDNQPSKKKEIGIGMIKGIIGTIPYVGPVLTEILFDIPGRIQQNRINRFVIILKEQIIAIDANKIDEEYMKSEEFFDLTRNVFENMVKTKTKEKYRALSKIYIDGITKKVNPDSDIISLFPVFIVELLPIQILLLSYIENNKNALSQIGSYSDFYNLFCNDNSTFSPGNYEFKYYCNNLENKGLITLEDGLEDFNSTSSLISFSDHKKPSVKITPLGQKFIAYLR